MIKIDPQIEDIEDMIIDASFTIHRASHIMTSLLDTRISAENRRTMLKKLTAALHELETMIRAYLNQHYKRNTKEELKLMLAWKDESNRNPDHRELNKKKNT